MTSQKPATVNEYFQTAAVTAASALVQLRSMREIIKKAAPDAEEVINYSMPAFKANGVIVWYAAFRQHIGLYPRPGAIQHFAKELTKYTTSKGAIQFPLDQPLPATVISKIVKFRLEEDAAEAAQKAAKKKTPAKKSAAKSQARKPIPARRKP